MIKLTSRSARQTQTLASNLATQLKPGAILTLSGPLGSGKTTFVQGLATALGITGYTKSPSFTLIRSYDLPNNPGQFHHLDLYRLKSKSDPVLLNIPELIAQGHHIIAIEWPDLVTDLLPPNAIEINFQVHGDHHRLITTNFKF